MEKSAQVAAYWRGYAEPRGLLDDDYDAFAFGDSAEMADELLELVLRGDKRATASLLRDYQTGGEVMPRPGGHSVVLDSLGAPQCILRTTAVEVAPLSATDAAFAWDEGEGDRTLAFWMDAHTDFFARQAVNEGFAMHPDIEVVLERFAVVWPEPVAHIRSETARDIEAVRAITSAAFAASAHGDSGEARLVDAIRAEHGAELISLVAERAGVVIGHILLSPVTVGDVRGMGLAPMSVTPALQRRGVGAQLIRAGLRALRAMRAPFVVVLGHPQLYRRFGFRPAAARGIACEFDGVPSDVWQVLQVVPDTPLSHGVARYLPAFRTVSS